MKQLYLPQILKYHVAHNVRMRVKEQMWLVVGEQMNYVREGLLIGHRLESNVILELQRELIIPVASQTRHSNLL